LASNPLRKKGKRDKGGKGACWCTQKRIKIRCSGNILPTETNSSKEGRRHALGALLFHQTSKSPTSRGKLLAVTLTHSPAAGAPPWRRGGLEKKPGGHTQGESSCGTAKKQGSEQKKTQMPRLLGLCIIKKKGGGQSKRCS